MSRWISVANRLPFTWVNGETRRATGGLVTAISGVKSRAAERIWIGSAPEGVTPEVWPKVNEKLKTQALSGGTWAYHPVFIERELHSRYYDGYCNSVLWPLLHYQLDLTHHSREAWTAYREVSRLFADEIIRLAAPDDLIWIHDFHLFLVPQIVKRERPDLKIGFFLHVPFPAWEIFRQLPERADILESLLACDLVGFHDYAYLRHFADSVLRLLGLEAEFLSIEKGGHHCRLGVFPVSIDSEFFSRKARETEVRARARKLARLPFVFLGVDRLDYMKGIDLKLKAFACFLQRFPLAKERVQLIQVAVPTRENVPAYKELASQTARLVGEINGRYSTLSWSPIHYMQASVDVQELVALYRSVDALLVSSKRDGMNLVALEFIAAQDRERPGVVLLSEFAGASSTLSHAIMHNPWDLEDTAMKMQIAIEMPRQEKLWRAEQMQSFLRRYSATDWAESFIAELEQCGHEAPLRRLEIDEAKPDIVRQRLEDIRVRRLLLFIDYDGTIVPIAPAPEFAVLNPATRRELETFAKFPWLKICIISGRDSRFLERQFSGLNLTLAAEHGAKVFEPETGQWRRRVHAVRKTWYSAALRIMNDYALRVPGSRVERKQFCVAWHYRLAPTEYGELQARKLAQELEQGLANLPVSIIRGKKIIEVRAIEADKGALARAMIDSSPPGTVPLAIGDDRTDEDLFAAIRGAGLSIHVGSGETMADHRLRSQTEVLTFLRELFTALDAALGQPVLYSPEVS